MFNKGKYIKYKVESADGCADLWFRLNMSDYSNSPLIKLTFDVAPGNDWCTLFVHVSMDFLFIFDLRLINYKLDNLPKMANPPSGLNKSVIPLLIRKIPLDLIPLESGINNYDESRLFEYLQQQDPEALELSTVMRDLVFCILNDNKQSTYLEFKQLLEGNLMMTELMHKVEMCHYYD